MTGDGPVTGHVKLLPRKAQAADAMATWCRSVAVVIFSSSRGRPVISARPSGSNASCRRRPPGGLADGME